MYTPTRILVLAGLAMLWSGAASADVSANLGFTSEYYYRGVLQKTSSASAGLDFEQGGFYLGTWTADVGDGLEVDGYLGYNYESDGGFTAGVGLTGYYYTGEFDDTYEEFNINLGYKLLSLEYSVGEWDGFGAGMDYDYLAITLENNGWYGTYGTFGDDFDGDFIEIGYGTEIGGFDVGIAAIFSSDEISDQLDSGLSPTESEALVLSISKSFSF